MSKQDFITDQPLLIAGATGHIGSALAFMNLTARFSSHLLLYGRNETKLLGLQEDLYDTGIEGLRVDTLNCLDALPQNALPVYVVYTLSERFERQARREDMLHANAALTRDFACQMRPYSEQIKLLICVSNPADAMGFVLQHYTGLSPEKVCCLSALDTTRFRKQLSRAIQKPIGSLREVYTLGSHDDQMALMRNLSVVEGSSLSELVEQGKLSLEDLEKVEEASVMGGRFIIRHRGYMTYESPAYLMLQMLQASVKGQKPFTLPASRLSEDPQYPGVFIALKTRIDETGVHQQVCELHGIDKERLEISYKSLKGQIDELRHKDYFQEIYK